MHKEVDFIAEYNEEMKELLAEPRRPQANGSGSVFEDCRSGGRYFCLHT